MLWIGTVVTLVTYSDLAAEPIRQCGVEGSMSTRTTVICVVSLVAQFVSSVPAMAQCGSGWLSLKDQMNRPTVTVVFRGSALEWQRRDSFLVMTFEVDRVWKGTVSRQVVLYQPVPRPGGPLTSGGLKPFRGGLRPFDMIRPFIVLAHHLNAQERREFGVDAADTRSLATSMCGDGSRPYSLAQAFGEVKGLGPGRKPQSSGVEETPYATKSPR